MSQDNCRKCNELDNNRMELYTEPIQYTTARFPQLLLQTTTTPSGTVGNIIHLHIAHITPNGISR